MSRLHVKICGLSQPGSVAAALAGGATHLGFIFFERSPRHVTPEQARALVGAVGGRASTVAVTVDAPDAVLDAIVAAMDPAMLQLHGTESPERVADLKRRHGRPVIKALPVSQRADLDNTAIYRGVADMILLDARPTKPTALPGGNGVPFDWALLEGLDREVDFMLSGGIDIGNVADALRLARPAGVDVSSGVESRPGVKDDDRITAFLRRVRQLEAQLSAGPVRQERRMA